MKNDKLTDVNIHVVNDWIAEITFAAKNKKAKYKVDISGPDSLYGNLNFFKIEDVYGRKNYFLPIQYTEGRLELNVCGDILEGEYCVMDCNEGHKDGKKIVAITIEGETYNLKLTKEQIEFLDWLYGKLDAYICIDVNKVEENIIEFGG